MPDYTITISAIDAKIISHVANKTGRNPRQMIEHLISNWASGQIEGYFFEKIRGKTTAELIALLGDIV